MGTHMIQLRLRPNAVGRDRIGRLIQAWRDGRPRRLVAQAVELGIERDNEGNPMYVAGQWHFGEEAPLGLIRDELRSIVLDNAVWAIVRYHDCPHETVGPYDSASDLNACSWDNAREFVYGDPPEEAFA